MVRVMRGRKEPDHSNIYGMLHLIACTKHQEEEVLGSYVGLLIQDVLNMQQSVALDKSIETYEN